MMYIKPSMFVMVSLLLTGCAHNQATQRSNADAHNRVVYTGSNVPRPRDELTPFPLSATTPSTSVTRHPDSLAPTEPVVGVTNNAADGGAETGPVSGTAGPAGSH